MPRFSSWIRAIEEGSRSESPWRGPRLCLSPCDRTAGRSYRGRSIDPLQWGGFAFLDRRGVGSGARLAQKLVRQALIADHRVRVGCLTAAGTDVGEPVLGATQAEIG